MVDDGLGFADCGFPDGFFHETRLSIRPQQQRVDHRAI
jgi:hypothetical protein